MRWLQLKGRLRTTVRPRSAPLFGLLLAAFAALQTLTAPAHAEDASGDVQACASAYEQAQVARNDGQLVEAQEHLRVCVQDHCPDFVKSDCGQWLSDIKRDIPSVIFSPVDGNGQELLDVKVSVDGKEVTLDGRAVELDPGQHEVTYEYQGETKTERVAIRQGEKNRVIKLEISTDKDTDGDGVMDSVDQCPAEVGPAPEGCPKEVIDVPPAKPDQGLRIGAYVSWGVGALGLAAFTYFGLEGNAAYNKAREQCPTGTSCDDPVEEKLIAEVDDNYLPANIGLGVGIAGAITGGVLFYLSMPKEGGQPVSESAMSVGVRPAPGGGTFSLGGAF